MTGTMLINAWGDTLAATAFLVVAILLIRKPFARHFGPKLTYALWLVPALRLILPPLPFADPVVIEPVPMADMPGAFMEIPSKGTMAMPAAPTLELYDFLPFLVGLWALGAFAVVAATLIAHGRFRREVLGDAVELEPIGSIRLVMSESVDGPVAFGLVRRFVAVPPDFFSRYLAEERALAIDHELSHHSHGDLWANSVALLLLATQWFNPLAWRALAAFRFDQEAACDARVLTMAGAESAELRTARYATAIAKAAVGSRLSLAAPMAVHDNLQERLKMLMQKNVSKKRSVAGRMLVGGAALAALSVTATLVPAGLARAAAQDSETSTQPASPAPTAPEALAHDVHKVVIFSDEETGDAKDSAGKKREIRRVIVHGNIDGDMMTHESEGVSGKMSHPQYHQLESLARSEKLAALKEQGNTAKAMSYSSFHQLGRLSRGQILAALKGQGITGKKANAIADKLEASRSHDVATAPLPPTPPVPPAAWTSADGANFAAEQCAHGQKSATIVKQDEMQGNKRHRHIIIHCTSANIAGRAAALRKAREGFVEGDAAANMSEEMRAKVIADMDRAIADMDRAIAVVEKKKD